MRVFIFYKYNFENIISNLQKTKKKELSKTLSASKAVTIDNSINNITNNAENLNPVDGLFKNKDNPKNLKIKRDSYIVSEQAIKLLKDADYSTLPHEFAHFWLDNMWSYSRSGAASDAYKNNFQALLDFLGVKDSQIYLTRGQQEKFARAYEK